MIRGTEVGCLYQLSTGTIADLHVVVLIPDEKIDITPLEQLLNKNGPEVRKAYINRMLDALRKVGCDLGCYHGFYQNEEWNCSKTSVKHDLNLCYDQDRKGL